MGRVKQMGAALLAAGLVLSLAACTAPAPEPTASPAPTAAFSFSGEILEPPLDDYAAHLIAPDFMDAEQESAYRRAMSLGGMLFIGTGAIDEFPMPDGTKARRPNADGTVEMRGNYAVSYGRFAQWEDFEAMMRSVFTPEYAEALITGPGEADRFVRLEDGRTGYLDMARGSDASYAGWWNDTYELVAQTGDTLEFQLIAHYGEWGTGQLTEANNETTAYPIRLERTGDGWRVAQFLIPF